MFSEDYTHEEWGFIPPPPPEEDEEPRWTWKRILFLIITLLIIVAFLGTTSLPGIAIWIEQRELPPEPTRTPLPRAYDEGDKKIEALADLDTIVIYIT